MAKKTKHMEMTVERCRHFVIETKPHGEDGSRWFVYVVDPEGDEDGSRFAGIAVVSPELRAQLEAIGATVVPPKQRTQEKKP